ncbi:hypothetical protein GYMLUDRAFT_61828 [Collybiopsis luxurians FD-317 M1]|uniref:Uncharacterized protein n=1 Tax=Collybiopsis luxurians FD-317 M1 TaxID=944289 RepID=A0A0D0CFC3_9AGAR|nr:hypothetical protein GYMLUDRAFT_61828 [Collybiopsis luxurians FD-317 M1]
MVINQPIPHLAKANPPPPPLMVLLAHRDLPKVRLCPLIGHTNLREVAGPSRSSQKTERIHPYTRPPHCRAASVALSSSSESNPSDDEQPGPTSVARISLVTKPKNASHLTLEDIREKMGWSQETFESCKNCLAELAELYLKPKAHKYQDKKKMEIVKDSIVKEYPPLKNFQQSWPIDILLMGILKRQREKAESRSSRVDAELCADRRSPLHNEGA